MTDPVVVVGGGLAAQRFCEVLRRAGFDGRIVMVCGEEHLPYDRPPLSKAMLTRPIRHERVARFRDATWYADNGIELRLGVRAIGLDAVGRRVELADGSSQTFDRLLIATGSRPRSLAALAGLENVGVLRTIEDCERLRAVIASRERLAIVGAGFIGQEVAASARTAGADVTLIEAAAVPLGHFLGQRLGEWFARLHTDEGARVILGSHVSRAEAADGRLHALVLQDGRTVPCDYALVGVGVVPDLDWLTGSGLDHAGVRVNDCGRTWIPEIYAAGDAAATFDAHIGRYLPGGHWEAAGRQAARAARSMVGQHPGPPVPTSFWSDQYGIRIQYVGNARAADEIHIDGDLHSRDFTALYTRGQRPVAALLVGRPNALPEIRRRLAAPSTDPKNPARPAADAMQRSADNPGDPWP